MKQIGALLLACGLACAAAYGQTATVKLRVAPATGAPDPGPTLIHGVTAAEPAGARCTAADLFVDYGGDCRIYFDFQDKQNFHFVDRQGNKIGVGLCEAGVEQVFATAELTSASGLRIARHGCYIGVFQDGALAAWAFDDRLNGGAAGLRMLNGEAPPVLKVEAREDVHFADDFMIEEGQSGQWQGNGSPQSGEFAVASLKNPLLSTKAFCYLGAGHNIYATVGAPWWDQYRYTVSLRGPGTGPIGLVFAFQDDKNYGLFRWSPRQAGNPGKRELVRVHSGQEQVLAQERGGYEPNQWYSATIDVNYTRVSVTLDGHTVLESADRYLTAGGAGVWCDVPLPAKPALAPRAQPFKLNSLRTLMEQHAVINDVRIDTLAGFQDDFRAPGPLRGGWLIGTGKWEVQVPEAATPEVRGELVVTPSGGPAKALVGDGRWAQYQVQVEIQPNGNAAGLILLHRDESNYYTAMLSNGQFELTRVADGVATVVDQVALAGISGVVRLKANIRRGHLRVTADDAATVETLDSQAQLKGRAGLLVSPGKGRSHFKAFKLSFLAENEALVTSNAVFDDESLMSAWAGAQSEWYTPPHPLVVEGRPVTVFLHHSQFPGDVELTVEPREFPEQKFDLALSVSKDLQSKNNGYVLLCSAGGTTAPGGAGMRLELLRQGQKVAEKDLAQDGHTLASLSLRRCGCFIAGVVNGRTEVTFRDAAPLQGAKVAFWTRGVRLRTEATKITSEHFKNELFSGAPCDWRVAGNAVAEVTNRWQCDPRWSFFSLYDDRTRKDQGKAAVLWSKRLYPDDVTVEFFVGNKMDYDRGTPYKYARDINVTICSDGSDLTKGYTCMFGGQGNTGSLITRNGVEVARNNTHIATDTSYHNRWYVIKVEKHGGRVFFSVNRFADENQPDLVYEDPEPLTGDHIALWTYDHGIMISRVRISGDGGSQRDDPDWQPPPLKTPYDSSQ